MYGTQLREAELQRRHAQQRAQRRAIQTVMNNAQQPPHYSALDDKGADSAMVGGESLDDLVHTNHQVMHRRRSLPQQAPYMTQASNDPRRLSMLDYTSSNAMHNGGFGDYQFSGMTSPAGTMPGGFPNMNNNMTIPGTSGNFSPQAMVAEDFYNPDMVENMMAFSNMNMESMGLDNSMTMFPNQPLSTNMRPNNVGVIRPDFNMNMPGSGNTLGDNVSLDKPDSVMMNNNAHFTQSNQNNNQSSNNVSLEVNMANAVNSYPPALSRQVSQLTAPSGPSRTSSYHSPMPTGSGSTPDSSRNSSNTPAFPPQPQTKTPKTIYSRSGFDMLRALWQVATRKDPQVNLGAVDMSCAFVVCDVTMNDCPIVYVSDNFQNLTGYSQHDIVGQNCRFLQAPDGKVEAGSKREFVDNGAVYNLKQKIAETQEVQQSLINYRKGGKPFLNLLTMIPIPGDTDEIRYIVGFQIDLVECPDAIASAQGAGSMKVNYKHSDIGQYVWTPPPSSQWEPENGQTLGVDDVSTLLQQFNPQGAVSDWHRQSWDKMLLENADDVVHVLSLKGLFLYLSPSCKRILEYDATELVGNSLSTICHPSDIVPVTRELKDTTSGNSVNIVFRIARKHSGYTWFESHGSLFVEQGKGRKCIILIGRKRPVLALSRRQLESHGGIGDSELWTKLSTSGLFLFVSANVRSLLDLQPDKLVNTSIQELMRKESRPEFGRAIEKARRGRIATVKHEVQNRRGQVLQAQTTLYPGDAAEGAKPTFILAQTKLLKASSRSTASTASSTGRQSATSTSQSLVPSTAQSKYSDGGAGLISAPGGGVAPGNQDHFLASEDNIFDELKTTRCTSWQYELRQMEKVNRILAEELHGLLSNKKKRKRRKGVGNVARDCANCHTRNTPEWRRGPSGQRDLCNSCGLRWAKQTGRVSPRNSSRGGNDNASKKSASPIHSSPLHKEVNSKDASILGRGSEADPSFNNMVRSVPNTDAAQSDISADPNNPPKSHVPPPSQPLLEGGAAGSAMTAIQEEREVSM
ncbi:PAS domain-containing protein [Microdochium trichocladiopsis]|uniref:PAS domain-containing protein n=1 Tax=Microdochium trichocladiopsis TaxID=1682393 RepID=A0A9P9BPP7_9PEZI|nr:PAS domain-containing protein [Microdochium trichocladiopsis]KAH7029320.1 PAS domain-containing protein [Microdochium trichocladiopsis]